ncbi:hypothetical protein DS843_16745, partial [Roseomonas genomospecies 6]
NASRLDAELSRAALEPVDIGAMLRTLADIHRATAEDDEETGGGEGGGGGGGPPPGGGGGGGAPPPPPYRRRGADQSAAYRSESSSKRALMPCATSGRSNGSSAFWDSWSHSMKS